MKKIILPISISLILMFLFYGSAKLFEKHKKYQREKEEVLINNIIELKKEINNRIDDLE